MIRPVSVADVEPALDLWGELMAAGQAADSRYTNARDARRVFGAYARDVWPRREPFPAAWVAVEDGLIGFVGILPQSPLPVVDRPRTALITDLYVAPDARRRGVGRQLAETAMAAAKSAGYPAIEVGTLAADGRARAFWAALGFGAWKVTLLR